MTPPLLLAGSCLYQHVATPLNYSSSPASDFTTQRFFLRKNPPVRINPCLIVCTRPHADTSPPQPPHTPPPAFLPSLVIMSRLFDL
jgi:hypothetical protein